MSVRDVADDATAPSWIPAQLAADWRTLATRTVSPAGFDPGLLAGLPEPARRWLTHAIAPGTALRRAAVFSQHGEIKVGRWQRFEADWVLTPPAGFVWAARTRLGPISIRGFDRYCGASGEMSWRLFGRIPLIGATGPDVTRSAAGRVAAELCFVPAAALTSFVRWEAIDDRRVTAIVDAGAWTHHVTLTVAQSGELERVEVPRWGAPDGNPFREHLFTAVFDGEVRFDGFTIPAGARAGWWLCPDGCAREEFLRLVIDHANYR